ncbi:hypothetical protein ABKN59_010293 [Abortiporus biennis]
MPHSSSEYAFAEIDDAILPKVSAMTIPRPPSAHPTYIRQPLQSLPLVANFCLQINRYWTEMVLPEEYRKYSDQRS